MLSFSTQDLSIGYRQGEALIEDINLSAHSGALTVMLGANGSGKSTLLRTLSGTIKPLRGHIRIGDTPLDRLSRRQLAQKLAVVLTDRNGAGGLTVREMVAIGRNPHLGILSRLSDEDSRQIDTAIADVGLDHKRHSFMAHLSDGERQKAMIARGLAQDTPIIFLDEPTSFLDVAARYEILILLSKIAHEKGKAIVLSTHDTAPALAVADNVWAILQNRKMACGTVNHLAQRGDLDLIYPGMIFDISKRDFR